MNLSTFILYIICAFSSNYLNSITIDMDKLPIALRNKYNHVGNGYIEISSKMAAETERSLYYDQNIHY